MKNENLYEYGRYSVQIIDNHIEDGYEVPGYGVINKHTGITEHSTTLLFHAMKWCRVCESQVAAIEKMGDEEEGTAELSWGAVEARPH